MDINSFKSTNKVNLSNRIDLSMEQNNNQESSDYKIVDPRAKMFIEFVKINQNIDQKDINSCTNIDQNYSFLPEGNIEQDSANSLANHTIFICIKCNEGFGYIQDNRDLGISSDKRNMFPKVLENKMCNDCSKGELSIKKTIQKSCSSKNKALYKMLLKEKIPNIENLNKNDLKEIRGLISLYLN